MSDDRSPTPEPVGERAALGSLAHRMNNALAAVVTNLNLLLEELEYAPIPTEARARLLQLIEGAGEGADRASELVRELKVVSWGRPDVDPGVGPDDDTWDSGAQASVLVIDDEPQILAAVTRALRKYTVTKASGGREAQDVIARGGDYDVILCDVMMGDLNGIDLFRWIRQERPDLADRLVFMTAGAFTRQVRQFLASVPNTVLHKPFDTKTLRWVVAQKLRGDMR